MKTAVVIGSTGLVGAQLVKKLVQEGSFRQIIALVRNKNSLTAPEFKNPKVRVLDFDFVKWGDLELQIRSFAGSSSVSFFCCLGTTIKKAGSETNFKLVDHDYVIEFAKLAHNCKAEQFLMVSALGADKNSTVFYNKVKGEAEEAVQNMFKGKYYFFRPSLLLGDRTEFRFGERIAVLLAPIYTPLLQGSFAQFKPVPAELVAQAMVNVATKKFQTSSVINNYEIFNLSK